MFPALPCFPSGPVDSNVRGEWEHLLQLGKFKESFALQWVNTWAAIRDAGESLNRRSVHHSMRSFDSYVRCLQYDSECIAVGLYDGSCQIAYFANKGTRTLPFRWIASACNCCVSHAIKCARVFNAIKCARVFPPFFVSLLSSYF